MEVEKAKKSALNNVSSLRERIAAVSMREEELLSNAFLASGDMARTTTELGLARDTISTLSKELANVAQLKSSINGLEDNVAF